MGWEHREKKEQKNKKRYPPARALKLYDRDNPKAEQRRVALLVRRARKGHPGLDRGGLVIAIV